MLRVDKTVFISYRRTNQFTALAIFKDLTTRGYDVFFDYNSIKAGDFEQIILSEIEARGHFLILLTPSALERCKEPRDWVRREIEHALQHKRNIIPLTFEGFDFGDMDKYLVGDLNVLKNYNALRVPVDYFDAAMDRLTNDYLNIPIGAVLHPTPKGNEAEVEQAIQDAKDKPQPTTDEMTAEEYFELALHRNDSDDDGKIRDYSEAIRLKPDYADAYVNRGNAYRHKGQYDHAFENYNQAILIKPDSYEAYNNRGVTYDEKGQYDLAIDDFNQAIRLKPDLAEVYVNRGGIYYEEGQYDLAIDDFNQAIRLKSDLASAYNNRGIAYRYQRQYDLAIDDFNQAISLDPNYASVYVNRGWTYYSKSEYDSTISDCDNAIRLNPNHVSAYHNRGLAYKMKGDYDLAIENFKHVIRINPEHETAYNYLNRGITYEKNGDLQQANENYQTYIDLGGEDADEVQKWIDANKDKL